MTDDPRSGESPQPLPIPTQIGRYRIITRLGRGGMGSVYLAEDTQLGRQVALKIPEFLANEGSEARERFFREARIAATLDHPFLCPVYDVGESHGHLFLTMAYLVGKSLAESVGGKAMPQRQVASLVGKLALAMGAAHAKGVVHRDLKPANIMIKETGVGQRREPVIVDFGLAFRNHSDDVRVTRSGQVMGTIGYMAPEQIRGELNEIGPACDIYALGVIFYELLTGQLPFLGSGLAVAGLILTVTPLPPSAFRPGLDPRLVAICLKAMAKQAEDRHDSMSALAAALTDYLRSPSMTTTSASPVLPPSGHTPGRQGSGTFGEPLIERPVSQANRAFGGSSPGPVDFSSVAPKGRHLWKPINIVAAVLGVMLLGVALLIATRKGRNTTIMNDPKAIIRVEGDHGPTRNTTAYVSPSPPSLAIPKKVINSVGISFVLIPSGEFLMGSPDSEMDAHDDAKPQHRVRLSRSFYLGSTEVTQGQYWAVTGMRPSWFKGTDTLPVERVGWYEATQFCNALSSKESLSPFYRIAGERVEVPDWNGAGYRLPTEAEWEYACRADHEATVSTSEDTTSLDEVGWCPGNSAGITHPVGTRRSNAWGLFDMHGNVYEWCWDRYEADYYQQSPLVDPRGSSQASLRVFRGGCYRHTLEQCRSAFRNKGRFFPGLQPYDLGFRVARTPPDLRR